jgi:predicted  nucleic acid-binding Zn-ribbon protein
MALRWNAALGNLEQAIERARRKKKPADRVGRAEELATHAKGLVQSVERASHRVAEIQPRVDRLEAFGREFRQSLGHAIDELSRDRSRERAHIAALRDRADQLETEDGQSPGDKDARLWEIAAIRTEVDRGRLIVDDLSFQIVQLQLRLESKNESHEREFAAATGELEGAISAVRTLTSELVRTLDEATSLVSSSGKRAGA